MKLVFPMPHMLRLKATCQPWEAAVTGPEQIRFAKWAEKLGYEMIAVPEHHVVPAEHVELSGPHYFNAHAGMACFAGATERIRVNSCRSEEHTSELQSLMRISYAVFCLKKKNKHN